MTGLRTAALAYWEGDGPSPCGRNSGPGWGAESEYGCGGARYRPPPAELLLRAAGSAAEWERVLRAAPAEGRHSEREAESAGNQPDHMTLEEEEELTGGEETAAKKASPHTETSNLNTPSLTFVFIYLYLLISNSFSAFDLFLYFIHSVDIFYNLCGKQTLPHIRKE